MYSIEEALCHARVICRKLLITRYCERHLCNQCFSYVDESLISVYIVVITKLSFLIGSLCAYAFVTQLDRFVGVLLQVSKLNFFKLLSPTRTY